MKKMIAIVAGVVALSAAGMPLAQNVKAPAPAAAGAQPSSTMDMKAQMEQMDEHMKAMQTLHARMASAGTPEERQQVMIAQRQEMQGCMAGMSTMMQGGAMTGGTGGMMHPHGKPADGDMQMQMMQKRMDMMQLMIQTMMDQQGMMTGPKPL